MNFGVLRPRLRPAGPVTEPAGLALYLGLKFNPQLPVVQSWISANPGLKSNPLF